MFEEVTRDHAQGWYAPLYDPRHSRATEKERRAYFQWKYEWWDAIGDAFPDLFIKKGYISVSPLHTNQPPRVH